MLEKLLERHKNPLSWIARFIFFVILYFGFWLHSYLLIILSIIGLATSWFWFPKPKKIFQWSEQLIEAELDYLKHPFSNSKAVATTFGIILFVISLLAFWHHNLLIGLLLIEVILLFKLCWAIFMLKKARCFISAVLIALMIGVGILLIIFS